MIKEMGVKVLNKYKEIYNEILTNSDSDSEYKIHIRAVPGCDLLEHLGVVCDYKFNGYWRRCKIMEVI